MKVVIAANAFKNSLSAEKACEAIATGLRLRSDQLDITEFPIADGGDGTGALLAKHLGASVCKTQVSDPIGRQIESVYWIYNKTAIIELANASGLRLLHTSEYSPLMATTFGTGQLIKHAIDSGIKSFIVCIGGSATVDGGIGVMRALGIKFLDQQFREIKEPKDLDQLHMIDINAQNFEGITIKILCDVANPLVGDSGSAAVFGPQKGADVFMIKKLDLALQQLSAVIAAQTQKDVSRIKYGGASGGVAAGLHGVLNADIINGIDYFLQVTNFSKHLNGAGVLITGEGSLDHQTLQGKAPFGVAEFAKQFSIPVIGMAGSVPEVDKPILYKYFDQLIAVNQKETSLQDSMRDTYANLVQAAASLRLIV